MQRVMERCHVKPLRQYLVDYNDDDDDDNDDDDDDDGEKLATAKRVPRVWEKQT